MFNKAKGCLIGLAIGDALGTSVEFRKRDSFDELVGIIGGGPFQLEPGEWTDDTSMALCLGYSLLECGFDTTDQLKKYHSWYRTGYCSSTGRCFDIGNTTSKALNKFYETGNIENNNSFQESGNGSLMRIAPIAIRYNCIENINSLDFCKLLSYSALSSKTTHAYEEPVQSCKLYSVMINRALKNNTMIYYKFQYISKDVVLKFNINMLNEYGITNKKVQDIALGSYKNKSRDQISSSGYVIDSLEAALWCFYNTSTFKDAVLLAANLGDDADTVAAICGQLAGAYYGIDNIPKEWINIIKMKDDILLLAEKLLK